MTLIDISSNKKIIITIVGILLTFTGYYLSVYKSFEYASKNQTYGGVMMIISIAIIQMMWLDVTKFTNKIQIAFLVIIGIVIIFGTMALRQSYLTKELNKNGIRTIATVVGFEIDNSGRKARSYAQLRYKCNGQQILQRVEYFDDIYKLNQKLNILASTENPQMFEIIKK